MLKKNSWIIFIFLMFFACDSNQVFDDYQSFPNKWHKDEIVSFTLTPPDSTKPYNLFLNIRNNNDYKYNNLFLIVELTHPNGKTIQDTLNYKMAAPDGRLLGSGFSDVKENKLWYKGYDKPFVFNESGEYSIKIQHAMRNNGEANGVVSLEGITDVGFRVESIKSN